MGTLWAIRKSGTVIDPDDLYFPNSMFFTLKIHHGGYIESNTERVYKEGDIDFVDFVDGEKISVMDINDMLKKLGYDDEEDDIMFYHFVKPGSDLRNGLKPLGGDTDVVEMIKYLEAHNVFDMYVEHRYSVIDSFGSSFVVIEEVDDDVGVNVLQLKDSARGSLTHRVNDRVKFLTYLENDNGPVNENDNGPGENDNGPTTENEETDEEVDGENNKETDEEADGESDEEHEFHPTVGSKVEVPVYKKGKKKVIDEDSDSDYVGSEYADSDELRSLSSSDDEEIVRKNTSTYPDFDVENDLKDPRFEIGMKFATADDVREAIRQYSIVNRRTLKFMKNDKLRIRVRCVGNAACPWVMLVSHNKDACQWVVATYKDKHMCNSSHNIKYVTPKWVARQYIETLRTNPTWPVESMRITVRTEHKLEISRSQAYRARKEAINMIFGSHSEQYGLLRRYCGEVMRTNPNTTLRFEFEPENPGQKDRQFKRLYYCLGGLKAGFLAGCRKVLGFDGAFLKTPYPGQLLSAVGIDANNGMYPVAWAVVEAENKDSWTWFLKQVIDDLMISNQQHWVFISDEQKGLVPAIEELLPGVEHRYCLQHIFSNYRKEHRGKKLKDMLFKIARATGFAKYQIELEKLRVENEKAYQWALGKPNKHWCKCYWTTAVKSDISMNNLCECFNGFIIAARDKPVISMLETIRNLLMKRIQKKRKEISKMGGPLCKDVQEKFEQAKNVAMEYITTWNGDNMYQVRGPWGEQCIVSLNARTCSCGLWSLTGIPCKHAISAIYYNGANGGDGVPEHWVHECYSLQTQAKIYDHTINPINGIDMWAHQEGYPITAPIPHKQPGRPKKLRRRGTNEMPKSHMGATKLGRRLVKLRCIRCGHAGHNIRRCTKEGGIGCPPKPTKRNNTEDQQGGGKRQRKNKGRREPAENVSLSQPAQNERPTTLPTRSSTQPPPPEQAQPSIPGSFMRGGRNVILPSSLEKWLGQRAEKEKNTK